jgi:predicted lipid-binding transport protein (Tim44 family)
MTSREQAGHTLENDVVGIKIVEALDLSLKDLTAQIQVRFVSEQIHTVRDAHGDVIEGVANMVDEIKDVWWFERNFDNQSPIWKLVRT